MRIEQLDIATFNSDVWKDVKKPVLSIDSPLFTHVAGLARVTSGLAILRKGICCDIAREWRWHEKVRSVDPEARRIGRGKAAMLKQLSAQLSESLETLNDDALEALSLADLLITVERRNFSVGEVNRDDSKRLLLEINGGTDFEKIKKAVACLAERAAKAVDIYRPKSRYLHGRPNWGGFAEQPGPGSLPQFTLRLLWDVRIAGGRLTLNKNSGTGTLIETLQLLSPYLPPGFIPKILPVSTLATMHALDKKLTATDVDDREFLVQMLDAKVSSD
jgi:hypothetical protein